MGKLKDAIEEAGITPGKVGACILIHEMIGKLAVVVGVYLI